MKSHHYIISFDPRDGSDNGLTVDRVQALEEGFCAEHFPGHQGLVCTHPDGHNYNGNIHVHIVINSLRIEEVPLLPYRDRPSNTRVGCKHRCTDAAIAMVSIKMFFFPISSLPLLMRNIPTNLQTISIACQPTWMQTANTMPIITPQSENSLTRTQRQCPLITTIPNTQINGIAYEY